MAPHACDLKNSRVNGSIFILAPQFGHLSFLTCIMQSPNQTASRRNAQASVPERKPMATMPDGNITKTMMQYLAVTVMAAFFAGPQLSDGIATLAYSSDSLPSNISR